MRDRRLLLARFFSYSAMGFQSAFVLSSLPWFISTANWGGTLLMIGFLVGTASALFVYPNLLKVLASVPYKWEVAVVLALSALLTGVAITRLPLVIDGSVSKLSDYIAIYGSGLFTLINIVAILVTVGASNASEGRMDSKL